jgi:AraC-like DNA-binding protein
MREITYEFVDLDSDDNFQLLGRSLGGIVKDKSLLFNNNIAKGELIKSSPDEGLWIRKWKFTVFQKLILHKVPPPVTDEKKFILIYFLDPTIFLLKNNKKNIRVSGPRNNMFLTSDMPMDFSVVPKQPFYVLDIAFTASWLEEQLSDADPSFKNIFHQYIGNNPAHTILAEPCTVEEYKALHELENSMVADVEDVLFIRSRVYSLVVSFFNKVVNKQDPELLNTTVHYDQLMQAKTLIMEDIQHAPKIETIARKVNLSVSSLLRQFKMIFGKSMYEYYVERKMELAKKMILENKMTVKAMAAMLGYKQVSAFIQTFTKQHGYSPGTLKVLNEKRLSL